MRILLLQLSDLHIHDHQSFAASAALAIADSVRGIEPSLDLCVVALTGDIARSGQSAEYFVAEDWLADLVGALKEGLGTEVPLRVVAIPGNHDCDFSIPAHARASLIDAMPKDQQIVTDPASAATCTAIQDAFFAFRDAHAANGLVSTTDRVYYEYEIVAASEKLRLMCLNTAWVSRLKEQPGSLAYPDGLLRDSSGDECLSITLLHHPPNWVLPLTAREIRRRLQRSSQVVLTGHEHEYAARSQRDESGGSLLYLDGAALESPGHKDASGFNAVIIDSTARQFRVVPYSYDGSRYVAIPGPFRTPTPFATRQMKGSGDFPVSPRMLKHLADPGVDLHHPGHGALTLDAIFVYPDLREIDILNLGRDSRIISSQALLAESAARSRLLITGSRESGRTCLAKRLFIDALDAGLVPLLLDGPSVRLRGDVLKDQGELASLFEEQYDSAGASYLRAARDQRILIVDNYDALQPKLAAAILQSLSHIAARVILLARDITEPLHELGNLALRGKDGSRGLHFQIMPYGHVRREEFIDRYVRLAAGDDAVQRESLRTEMRTMLDTALGHNYAPPVPIVIVSLLQARAFNDNLDLSQSTYGYYFELLVKRSLVSAYKPAEYDVAIAYLSALAGELHADGGRTSWPEEWFMAFHTRFVTERKLRLRLAEVQGTLLDRGILVRTEDEYTFRHKYCRYYFTAKYLADRLNTDEGRIEVLALTERLAEEDPANVLLFLTHLSKDPTIIDAMLKRAATLLANVERATLARRTVPLPVDDPEMEACLRAAVYEERPIQESRTRYLAELDSAENKAGSSSPSQDNLTDQGASSGTPGQDAQARTEQSESLAQVTVFAKKMDEVLRTMQILGQLLKNFPGTLTGAQKMRLTETVYDLGLRFLGAVFELLRQRLNNAAGQVVDTLRRENPDMQDHDIFQQVRNIVAYLAYAAAYGMVQRIAANVATPLLQPVYDEIESADPVPAVRLVSLALKLDRVGKFPVVAIENLVADEHRNTMAMRVAIGLVLTHFHLFEVDQEIKRQVCTALGVDFKPLPARDASKTRLIGHGPSGKP